MPTRVTGLPTIFSGSNTLFSVYLPIYLCLFNFASRRQKFRIPVSNLLSKFIERVKKFHFKKLNAYLKQIVNSSL